MKKILFMSDVDGTLVDGGYIHPRVAEAAREFTARGHLFALATGRHKFSIGALCEQLPVNAPCIILAGAATYNSAAGTCENLFPMEEGVKAALARILAEYPAELAVQVFTARTQFNLRLNDFLRRHGIAEEVGKPDAPLSALQGEQILKLGFNCEDTAVLERCAAEFSRIRTAMNGTTPSASASRCVTLWPARETPCAGCWRQGTSEPTASPWPATAPMTCPCFPARTCGLRRGMRRRRCWRGQTMWWLRRGRAAWRTHWSCC